MNLPQIIRAAGCLLLPVRAPLPKRYWRWTWLAMIVRLVIGVPFRIAFAGPYLLAKGLCSILDLAGGLLGSVTVHCYNRDLKNSGWKPAGRREPPPRLGPDWVNPGRTA